MTQQVAHDMVTGVTADHHEIEYQRSSSLSPPNQQYPEELINKLHQLMQTETQQTSGVPRLPQAMCKTMPTFDGKIHKCEHFEDLYKTSLEVYPNIIEEEKILDFHFLLKREALQTFRKMTKPTKNQLSDILAGFRGRYVTPLSIATACCKRGNLAFKPAQQPFLNFLEQNQTLIQAAYGIDASKFSEPSTYVKCPSPREDSKPGPT